MVGRLFFLGFLMGGLTYSSLHGQTQVPERESEIAPFLGPVKFEMQQVFKNQRFPNVVVTKKGTLLATWGSSSVFVRRSEDGGESWGPRITVCDSGIHGGGTTVDETTGDILVFVEKGHPPSPLTVYRSRDDGISWQAESETVVHPDSEGHAPSMHMNEHGITLRHGSKKGRLLRASRFYGQKNDRSEWPNHYTNAVYSDDGGKTWQTSEPFPERGTGEATLAELADGTIYYNSRVHWDQRPQNTRRRSAISKDGGQTWTDWDIVEILPDGHQQRSYGCMGGLTRLPVKDRDILVFSNIDTPNAKRERATVWASFDGGQTWPIKRLVFDGPSAYSSLTSGRPGTPSEGWIYLHFEGGPEGGSQIARFNLSWLLQGEATGDGDVPEEFRQAALRVPEDVRQEFSLDDFYQKHIDVGGLPVVGSQKVSDAAMREAAWIVDKMVGHRPDILQRMADNKTRLAVMAWNEYTSDVPEHRHLEPRVYWDRRARGLGATPQAPAVSCAEENLLGHPNDPYATENICIHEFAHAIHQMGMVDVDPSFEARLKQAYRQAMAAGLWKGTYAAVDPMEYWAEGVQSWFDDNRENDALHNHVNTRSELQAYDADLANLCKQVFGDGSWRYLKPQFRQPNERQHLVDVKFDQLPAFGWRSEPIPQKPRVRIDTALGEIELELDRDAAPQTVRNFLHYVHQGLYSDGVFYRTVTDDNQPNHEVKIAMIQASPDPDRVASLPPAIPLERTRDSGLTHRHGSITMSREGLGVGQSTIAYAPDTAQGDFAICIGDQPELDYAGQRTDDRQGFAVFGRVVKGMKIVEVIHQSKAEGQWLNPPIKIQRAVRLN